VPATDDAGASLVADALVIFAPVGGRNRSSDADACGRLGEPQAGRMVARVPAAEQLAARRGGAPAAGDEEVLGTDRRPQRRVRRRE
jgi:hypothetical protein